MCSVLEDVLRCVCVCVEVCVCVCSSPFPYFQGNGKSEGQPKDFVTMATWTARLVWSSAVDRIGLTSQ